MKRDYMIGNFDKDLEKTIELVKDKHITEDARIDLLEDFCSVYINFDSSKFDKYFI